MAGLRASLTKGDWVDDDVHLSLLPRLKGPQKFCKIFLLLLVKLKLKDQIEELYGILQCQ